MYEVLACVYIYMQTFGQNKEFMSWITKCYLTQKFHILGACMFLCLSDGKENLCSGKKITDKMP